MDNEVQKDLFTPNNIFDEIKSNDFTVEVIGYVDRIVGRHVLGEGKKFEIFKFFVSNAAGRTVQVVAWDDRIVQVEDKFTVNSVVHIDGALAKLPKEAKWNDGNVEYELNICVNTEVNVLGVYNEEIFVPLPKEVSLEGVGNLKGLIKVEGYIKTNFGQLQTKNQCIVLGSITDVFFKLEVRLPNTIEQHSFRKGELVSITGTVKKYESGPPFLQVKSFDDVKKLRGLKMSFASLLNGFKIPKCE